MRAIETTASAHWSFQVGITGETRASWWLHAESGDIPAWAGEQFPDLAAAASACRAFKLGSGSWHYEVVEFQPGRFRWHALDEGGSLVARSMFSSRDHASAESALHRVRAHAAHAAGP